MNKYLGLGTEIKNKNNLHFCSYIDSYLFYSYGNCITEMLQN